MKSLKVVIFSIITYILCSSVVVFASEIDSNSIAGTEVAPSISVVGNYENGKIEFKISNNSDSDMRDVYLISPDSDIVFDKYIISLGKIGVGDEREYILDSFNIKSSKLSNIIKELGGYVWFENIFVVVVISLVLLAVCFFCRKHESRKYIIAVSVIMIVFCSLSSYYGYKQNRIVKYTPGKEGKNYTMTVEVPNKGKEILFDLKYTQDDVVYKTEENTEYIDFDTEYEYDPDIACSDKPIVKEKGLKGIKKVVSTVKYVNGEKVDSFIESEDTVKEPERQLEIQGTKTTIDLVNIDAKREYVEDESMKVGDYKLITDLSTAKNNTGKKEVKYTWDASKKRVVKSEKVTKEPGVNRWKAGCLVVREEITNANTRYVAVEDKPVGWSNTIKQSKIGVKTTVYKTKISPETGKPVDENDLSYYTTLKTEPVSGRVEVGVLKEEDVVTDRGTKYQKDKSKWDNYENVVTDGQDKIERVTSIMKLDQKTGVVSDIVEKEVSRKVTQKEIKRVIVVGTKKPEWIEEKIATEQVKYNTIYKPDKTLSGDETVVAVKGENGRLITTQLVAVDEKGNKIQSYEPKIVEENALQKPIDEVIMVSPDSKLLQK